MNGTPAAPKIALISSTPLAIPPASGALAEAFPDGTVWNLLDDRLLADAAADGGISDALAQRMDGLIQLAIDGGADGVLLTCSQYWSRATARDRSADGIAVYAADGPLFAEVAQRAPERVLLVASLESAATDSTDRLRSALHDAGVDASIVSIVVSAAASPMPAEQLANALADAIDAVTEPYDLVVLAQYSLAPAAPALAERLPVPVLDGPSVAAGRLAEELGASA